MGCCRSTGFSGKKTNKKRRTDRRMKIKPIYTGLHRIYDLTGTQGGLDASLRSKLFSQCIEC